MRIACEIHYRGKIPRISIAEPGIPSKIRIHKYYILSLLCAALLDWLEAF